MADKEKAKEGPGTAEVQAAADRETDQGFRGVEVDPTPNDHYTVAGVVAGKPTPETDPDYADSIRPAVREVERKMNGVAER